MGSTAASWDGEVRGAVAARRLGTLKKMSWVAVWMKSFGRGRVFRSASMLIFPWLVPGELPEYVETGDPARGP